LLTTGDVVVNAVTVIASIAALLVSLKRRHVSRVDELRRIGEEAVLIAKRKSSDGLSVDRLALETAILLDVQQDGKRDYTRQQLWASVEAALARDAGK
jgi:hypothetical protein